MALIWKMRSRCASWHLSIFDQTKSVHGLGAECREWIDAAAMLYEVGMYINPVGLHRHAYYVISRSELYGFTPLQRKIIATVARFQGNSKPQLRDRLIKLLPAQIRSDVIKATAILRVARALNQGRRSAVESIRASRSRRRCDYGSKNRTRRRRPGIVGRRKRASLFPRGLWPRTGL